MPLEHPDFLKNNPYYDDFSDEKNFLRVLFKPGYAVQARELTQLQTLLQSQISKFADHIFKEGSKVFGGNVNTASVTFIRVEKNLILPAVSEPTFSNTTADSYLNTLKLNTSSLYVSNDENSSYIGSVQHIELEIFPIDENENYDFTEPTGTLRLVHFANSGYSSNDDYTILFVDRTSGEEIFSDSILKVKNEEIYFKVISSNELISNVNIIEPIGTATLVSVDAGIYYTNGLFVNNQRQYFCVYHNSAEGETEISLSNGVLYTNAPENVRLYSFSSSRVGFNVIKSSIDIEDDITLRDPAKGFYNSNAPGADRYKIDLILNSLPYNSSSVEIDNYANKDFIQLVRIVKGNVDWVKKLTNYSEILDLIARRTFEESGSYTVKPFPVDVKNHLRRDLFELIVQNSPEDNNSNSYLEVGGFIWSTTDINGAIVTNVPNFFTLTDFTNYSYSIAKIISIIPFRENDANSTNSTIITKKIYIQPLNKIRFLFNPNIYQNFNYKKSQVSTQVTISAKYSKFITDSEGIYSVYDDPTGDKNKLILGVQPGKAYVYGYEQEFYSTNNIEYLKGRESIDRQSQLSTLSSGQFLGNYVVGNFIQHNLSVNIDTTIDWEKLPKFELQSDDIFTLIMKKGENLQASGIIHSWTPFDVLTNTTNESRKMFNFNGENSSTQEFESVILIK